MTGILEYTSRGREVTPVVAARPATVRGRSHPSTWRQPATKVPYLPGLDGLRALAVVSVLLYHGDVAQMWSGNFKGGFLGVEVFFVISGYLITAILLAQWRTERRIGLKTFYARRARRLLPALFLTLFACALVSVLFLHDEVATLRGDIVSSLAYVTNWFFVFSQKSYFENTGRPSLVQHLWSLAVEEQFYLVWPLLFAAGMRFLGRRRLLVAIVVAALASSALMALLYRSGGDPSRVYYGTDTRAAGLLIGAALAFVWTPYRLHKRVGVGAPILLDAVGLLALAVLVWMLLAVDQFSDALYRGGFLQVSIVTALVIAVVVHPAARLGRVVGMRPLRWIGLRSYGIYLYHWPVFQLTRPTLDIPLTGYPLLVLRFVLTFGIATASYKYVETPIRSGAFHRAVERWREGAALERRQWTLRWGSIATASLTVVLLVGVFVARAEPPATPDYLIAGATTSGLPPGPADTVARPSPAGARGAGTTTSVPAVGTDPGSTVDPPVDPGATVVTPDPVGDPGATAPPPTGADGLPVPTDPPATDPPPPARRITALGDSVMLGAAAALEGTLNGSTFVDAKVSRQVSECLSILHVWHDNGLLGDVVVVHIGNNGTYTDEQANELRDILAGVAKVVVLSVKVPRQWEGPNNEVIGRLVGSMPNAVFIDWKAEGDAHPEFFYADGMHLRADGAAYYAGLINAAL